MRAKQVNSRGLSTYQQQSQSFNVIIWQKGAMSGNQECQFYLAQAYEYGWAGLPEILDTAIYWYEQSAAQGHKEAKSALNRIKSI